MEVAAQLGGYVVFNSHQPWHGHSHTGWCVSWEPVLEIAKRDVCSTARIQMDSQDVGYSSVSLDFMPETALDTAMRCLSRALHSSSLRWMSSSVQQTRNDAAAVHQMSQACGQGGGV